jgi:hypothetical protein
MLYHLPQSPQRTLHFLPLSLRRMLRMLYRLPQSAQRTLHGLP